MNEIKLDSVTRKAESIAMRKIYNEKHQKLGLTQALLARQYKSEPPTISNYLNGKIPLNLNFALFFAEKLQVELKDFSPRLDQEYNQLAEHKNLAFRFPLIQHKDIDSLLNGLYTTNDKLIPSPVDCGSRSFWIESKDPNMNYPHDVTFAPFIQLLVDPDQVAKINEYALCKISLGSEEKYILRRINHNGSQFIACCSNPDIPPISLNSEIISIVGKVISAKYPSCIFNS